MKVITLKRLLSTPNQRSTSEIRTGMKGMFITAEGHENFAETPICLQCIVGMSAMDASFQITLASMQADFLDLTAINPIQD